MDSATRKVQACKSNASSADLPIPPQLEAKLLGHLANNRSQTGLLFFNKNGRPYSANKLREKQLHPLLTRLGIPHGGFHAARHGATSEMMAHGVAPTVVQKQMRTAQQPAAAFLYVKIQCRLESTSFLGSASSRNENGRFLVILNRRLLLIVALPELTSLTDSSASLVAHGRSMRINRGRRSLAILSTPYVSTVFELVVLPSFL